MTSMVILSVLILVLFKKSIEESLKRCRGGLYQQSLPPTDNLNKPAPTDAIPEQPDMISNMSTVQLEIPEEVLISLKQTPETIARELQILAAVKLFELGKLSSGRAAQLAGMSRVQFLLLLGQYQVSPFSLSTEELERDVISCPIASDLHI